MFSYSDDITFHPKSGRPEAPIHWKLTTFFIVFGWTMALLATVGSWLAWRDGAFGIATAMAAAGAFILIFVYWRKREVTKAEVRFRQLVSDYERTLASPPW